MPSHVPTPVAAALGIVPAVFEGFRRLPMRAIQFPVVALSSALTSYGNARREYDALAQRGERLIAQLRGTSFDEVEDKVEDALEGTRLATPYDRVEDALEDAGEAIASLAGSAPWSFAKTGPAGLDAAQRAAGTAAGAAAGANAGSEDTSSDDGSSEDTTSEEEQPKGAPTPKATQPDATRIDTAAAPDVVETVEELTARIGGVVVDHDELPLPDYDHMTLGSLRGRMRSLDLPQLVVVRDYEKAHADRLPIVTMLDNRIAKLASDPTAPLSGGSAGATAEPSGRRAKRGGQKVSPSTAAPAEVTAPPQFAFGGLGGPGASHPN
ncbi:MAG: hypothetical protein JWN88_2118 [Frankiales bacterium]|nr:hypothetical protein [Frankiales bacterium]